MFALCSHDNSDNHNFVWWLYYHFNSDNHNVHLMTSVRLKLLQNLILISFRMHHAVQLSITNIRRFCSFKCDLKNPKLNALDNRPLYVNKSRNRPKSNSRMFSLTTGGTFPNGLKERMDVKTNPRCSRRHKRQLPREVDCLTC